MDDANGPPPVDAAPVTPEAVRSPRRFARLFLVLGAAIAVGFLAPHVPRERTIELRLQEPATIVGVDVAWTAGASADADPIQGASWQFAPGAAPRSLSSAVRLPDGGYDVDVTVRRVDGAESIRRTVTLGDAERVTVSLR